MAPYTNVSGLYDTQRRVGDVKGKTLTYIGDARNNVANDLLVTGALLGVNMNIVAPESRLPESHVVAMAKDYAEQTGATIQISSDIERLFIKRMLFIRMFGFQWENQQML